MGALLALLAIVFLGIGIGLYVSVSNAVTPLLPLEFQEGVGPRMALDTYIWICPVPASIREQYAMSSALSAVAFVLLAGALLATGQIVGAILFVLVSAVAVFHSVRSWLKCLKSRSAD